VILTNPFNVGAGQPPPTFTFSNAKLLMHGSARPFIDAGPNKRLAVNHQGLCTLSSGAISGNNANAALRIYGADSDWQFGSGSWFISARVNYNGANTRIFDSRPTAGSSSGWAMAIQASTGVPFMTIEGTTYGTGTPAANLTVGGGANHDVAFSYDGSVLRCFVDGAVSWSHTVALNIDTGGILAIHNTADLTNGNTGSLLSELLIVSGEAVATSVYGLPTTWTDTGTLIEGWDPATYSNVKLNVHGSGTNGGTTFTDTSASARTVTANGNVQTSTAQARIGSSSILFDGTGDFLTVPQSSDFTFAADFTVEMQVRTASTSRQVLISCYQDSTTGWTLQISLTNAGRVLFSATGDGAEIDTNAGYLPVATNTWTHVMVARWGTFLLLFIEGEAVMLVSDSQTLTDSVALYIGRLTTVSTSIDFNGYMQEIRVVKGEAPHRSFSVQTAAHPDS